MISVAKTPMNHEICLQKSMEVLYHASDAEMLEFELDIEQYVSNLENYFRVIYFIAELVDADKIAWWMKRSAELCAFHGSELKSDLLFYMILTPGQFINKLQQNISCMFADTPERRICIIQKCRNRNNKIRRA